LKKATPNTWECSNSKPNKKNTNGQQFFEFVCVKCRTQPKSHNNCTIGWGEASQLATTSKRRRPETLGGSLGYATAANHLGRFLSRESGYNSFPDKSSFGSSSFGMSSIGCCSSAKCSFDNCPFDNSPFAYLRPFPFAHSGQNLQMCSKGNHTRPSSAFF
jgi:hypothetical protein